MRALPVGVPKLIVSTIAAGDTRPIVGASDMLLAASVVDVAGINSRLGAHPRQRRGGHGRHGPGARRSSWGRAGPLIAASMFGVTTPCVTHAAEVLDGARLRGAHVPHDRHGRALDGGADRGRLHRRRARRHDHRAVRRARRRRAQRRARPARPRPAAPACRRSSRWARSTWSTSGRARPSRPQFEDRNLYVHNAQVTLMRTTPEECARLGEEIARKLSAATGPVALFIPLGGISMIATPGRAVPRRRRPTRRCSRPCARTAGPNVELIELETRHQRPGLRRGDGRQAPRLPRRCRVKRAEALARLQRDDRERPGGDRRGCGHRALGQVRRGRRRRPDHHLQLRPLPHGRPRLALGADALRRRQRDRRRHGARGAAGRARTCRCWRACAAPIRSG